MLVAVFGDAHAHAEALEAVIAAAVASGARECWSLGDMVGGGPDPERAVALTRARCTVAMAGNHDYGATGSVDPLRLGEPGLRGAPLDRAGVRKPERRGHPMAALAQAGGAPRRRPVLAREPTKPGLGVRRTGQRGSVPGHPTRSARPHRPHPPRRARGRRRPDAARVGSESVPTCRSTSAPASGC